MSFLHYYIYIYNDWLVILTVPLTDYGVSNVTTWYDAEDIAIISKRLAQKRAVKMLHCSWW